MAKVKTNYVCNQCGYITPKWSGRCPECGSWGSFEEKFPEKSSESARSKKEPDIKKLKDVGGIEVSRFKTGLVELDQVLGGGCVKGSVVLVGGEPGVGKSTIMLQVTSVFSSGNMDVLYVSSEESRSQIKLRADRLHLKDLDFDIISTNDFDEVEAAISSHDYNFLVLDSVQTIASDDLKSPAGTVSQVKYITYNLVEFAKSTGLTVFIVGQVTKEGAIAGPKILEHLVDTVLYFEGDYSKGVRILRAVKNRFGSTNEVGLFEMRNEGLVEISGFDFLENTDNSAGKIMTCVMEGTRAFLIEIQALVSSTYFNFPKRNANGFDLNRLQMLLAIVEKRCGINLSGADVFLNVAGGLKVNETSADLAICACLISSFKDTLPPESSLFIGEVGLTGEVRLPGNIDSRLKEAAKFGIKTVFMPSGDTKKQDISKNDKITGGLEIININYVNEIIEYI
ncbi:DNA repair protein RadA [Flexistipes sp.]|uniref:DNA repair protein RadA n=1 Tax=Flexistipes sp. TaxID=3088135 RepID=UPI002E1B47C7|nr:DNA repair protein RadA [Flexistipes sp.]